MAFSLDPARNHLALDEADIISLFSTPHPAVPQDPRFMGHPCQAYICTSRENNLLHVFVAILDTTSKLPSIFTSSCAAKDNGKFGRLVKEAHSLAGSMGFTLEPVNLDYSTAMRQVIIRSHRIMRPPEPHRLPPAAQADSIAPQAAAKPVCSEASHQDHVSTPPQTECLPPEKHNPATDQQTESLFDQISQLRKENSEAESTISALHDTNNRQLKEHHSRLQEMEERLLEANAVCTELRAVLATEAALRRDLELTAAGSEDRLQKELMSLRGEQEERCAELCRQNETIMSLTRERDRLDEELKRAYAANEAMLQEEQRSAATGLEQQVKDMRRLESNLEELTATYEGVLIEKELERRRSAAEIKSVTARFERISAEKRVLDSIAANFRKKARTVVEKLQKEKAHLEKELQRFKSLAQTAIPQSQPRATESVKEQESPFASLGLTSQTAFSGFGASVAGNGADFHHDPNIDTIHYSAADEIIDLYGSGNAIQAAPFGRRAQNCIAFIFVVERESGAQIYLAWQLTEEGVVLFCQPEKQPLNSGNYARMIQAALCYFESVGFIMDRFELSSKSERQLLALEKNGLCRRDPAPALSHDHDITGSGDICHLQAAA